MTTTQSPMMGLARLVVYFMLLFGVGAVVVAAVVETKPQTVARPKKLVKHAEAVTGYELMNGDAGGCHQSWIYYNQVLGNIAYICQYTNLEPFMCYGVIMVGSENGGNRIFKPGAIPDRTCYAMTCMQWFARLAVETNGVYTDWDGLDPVMRARMKLEGWTFGGGK